MGQAHLLEIRPNSLEDPMEWIGTGPYIQETKGILTDRREDNHSREIGDTSSKLLSEEPNTDNPRPQETL